MPLELVTIPCLADNYAFLLHSTETGETALIDIPEAKPISEELAKRGWNLTDVWITHHHWDHIDGLNDLSEASDARIVGAANDKDRLPPLHLSVSDGETFSFAGHDVQVFDVSGHTMGHIAFHVPDALAVFTADSLMAMGCGRLFEGSPQVMWKSLSKLAALPPETLVCSGHEYTAANAKFALTVDPDNADLTNRVVEITAMREKGKPTVPSSLDLELRTNPFFRAVAPSVKAHLGLPDASDAECFAEIRRRKDNF